MKILQNFVGKSQFDEDIHSPYRPSACGPTTAYVMLNYLANNKNGYSVNDFYRTLKSTKIGLFKWRFIRHLKKLLGPDWTIASCTINEVLKQIDEGRPVAAKFDKWFRFRWSGQFSYIYHWVPVIGYEKKDNKIFLIVHDNGSRNHKSVVRHIPYEPNQAILSFVKIEPNKK